MTLIDLGLLCLFPVLFILSKALDRKEWVGLTDEEVREICVNQWGGYEQCRAIEAKLKEKNV